MRMDCEGCTSSFPTKKLYIKHIKSKECLKNKRPVTFSGPQQASKRARIEVMPVSQSGKLTILQSQISQLTRRQKDQLQLQLVEKQKQVLQTVPVSQLSNKQKVSLKRISTSNSVTTEGRSDKAPLMRVEKIKVVTLGDRQVTQTRRRTYQRVNSTKPVSIQANKGLRDEDSDLPVITEFHFSDEPIAAEETEGDPIAVSSDSGCKNESIMVGSLKIKNIARAFQNIANISTERSSSVFAEQVKPSPKTATPKVNCQYCRKIFSKSGISQHIDYKHKTKCKFCESRHFEEELAAHIEQKHKVKCQYCEQRIFEGEREEHEEKEHREQCTKCQEKLLKTEIQDHILKVHERERCNECPARFESKDLLEDHMNSDHLTEVCAECDGRFRTELDLEDHMATDHPSEMCEECEAVFGRVSELEDHKVKVHPNPKKFLNFNGGMFMMMIKDDEEDTENETIEAMDDDSEDKEKLEKALLREKEELENSIREILVEVADDIVKTAMTGTVLFALRIDHTEDDEMYTDDDYYY